MEGTTRHRKPGRHESRSQDHDRDATTRSLSLDERAESHPYVRRRRVSQIREGFHCTGAFNGQSQGAKGSRQKRGRSPQGFPSTGNRENGPWGEQWRRHSQGSGKEKPSSLRAGGHPRRDSARTPRHLTARRSLSRLPVKTSHRGRYQDSSETRPPSPKRCPPPPSPEAFRRLLSSRLFTHLGALEETLRELQTPGGAFLRVPGPPGATQPTVSQRAWLTWQLAHAGATLHWTLAALDSLLATAQHWPAAPQHLPAAPLAHTPWASWGPWP